MLPSKYRSKINTCCLSHALLMDAKTFLVPCSMVLNSFLKVRCRPIRYCCPQSYGLISITEFSSLFCGIVFSVVF